MSNESLIQQVKLVSATAVNPTYLAEIRASFREIDERGFTAGPEDILVHIARASSSRTDTFADKPKLINYLINNQHWSPFEHTFMTVEVVTSLPIATQYLRHRSLTFQQFSQRYARVSDVMTIELRHQAETNRQSSTDVIGKISFFINDTWDFEVSDFGSAADEETLEIAGVAICDSLDAYGDLLDRKVSRETARFVLPQSVATTLYMSGPLRSWIHIVNLREDGHAQKEAQDIASKVKEILMKEYPIVTEALTWQPNS